jgi:putative two-component system response regulator
MQLQYQVLVVDDVVENIQMAMNILREEHYDLSFALSGKEALDTVTQKQFDLILLDIMMPQMDGYEVCSRLREMPDYSEAPIIFLTAKSDIDSLSKAFEHGGSDYVTKPFHAEELLSRVRSHLELHRSRLVLKEHNLSLQAKIKYEKKRLLEEITQVQEEIILILSEMIESCSQETGSHVKRVALMSRMIAEHSTLFTEEDVDTIYHAAPLHDIGKVLVPDAILHKNMKLSDEEFETMKIHTTDVHRFLGHSRRKVIRAADIIAAQHHEWWDGSGYPYGLKSEQIHPYGRVVAIADVFDALTHKRVYKDAWSIEDAVAYMRTHAGSQFDPDLIDVFMEHLDDIVAIVETQ